jgi:hypothetical protein
MLQGLRRGEAILALQARLEDLGLYEGQMDSPEAVWLSKFGDVVTIRDSRDVKRDPGDVNLRKPVLVVSLSEGGPNVTMSVSLNTEPCDNKMTDTVAGRTGGFCTACTATESDMHGARPTQPYLMNLGADQVWDHFDRLLEEMGRVEDRLEDVVIPSARGDYASRLGTKTAPLSDQIEFTKVKLIKFIKVKLNKPIQALSVLHATKLRLYEWVRELAVRTGAGVAQWGAGRLPKVTFTAKNKTKRKHLSGRRPEDEGGEGAAGEAARPGARLRREERA